MSSLLIENLSIRFKVYKDKSRSLKEIITNFKAGKSQKQDTAFWALKNINLDIQKGDRLGIIGHNGAGKSTLLKAICRIYEPTIGKILIKGSIVPLLEIGAGFHPEYTGKENIYLNGAILGHRNKVIKSFEQDVIRFAELENFIHMPVKYYSTGMYMKLGFSLATAVTPDILILDEVFAGGDHGFINKATKRMNQLINDANILLMVSHDISLIQKHCNRVLWLDRGATKMFGSPDQIIPIYNEHYEQLA